MNSIHECKFTECECEWEWAFSRHFRTECECECELKISKRTNSPPNSVKNFQKHHLFLVYFIFKTILLKNFYFNYYFPNKQYQF
jgi:hypothetical protein